MSQKTIQIIGSLNADLVMLTPHIPKGGETLEGSSFSTGSGGKGANQAVACSRLSRRKSKGGGVLPLGVTVKMVGAVGADQFGPTLIDSLKRDGVDTTRVRVVDGQTTGIAVIIVEEASGENRILLHPGANHTLQPSNFLTRESLGTPLPDLLVMQLEIPLETVLKILVTAKEAAVDVLLNPAPAVILPDEAYKCITHLILNESEAAILTGKAIEELEQDTFDWRIVTDEFLRKGVENVIVTLGAKGAYFADANDSHYVPAAKVNKVVDTTAAGDTFVGAYASAVVRERGTTKVDINTKITALKWACRAAARTVERHGAQASIPWIDEVINST
ncbi:hypothetical protein B7494_g4926 [Chlorociboria aeruginascens]|nr:hypothetical protein B7494_g4926 [Chlorociboria aeruginascens]